MAVSFPLDEVKYIERIVVGPTRPDKIPSNDELQAQMDWVNRCLSDGRGLLIGSEKGVVVIHTSGQQIVLQHTVYHVGFRRKPVWIAEGPKAPPATLHLPEVIAERL